MTIPNRSKLHILFLLLIISSLGGCASQNYTMRSDHSTLFSLAMNRTMAYSVYTPPGWTPDEHLPVMVLLHGARDDHRTFDRYDVGLYLDEQIVSGDLPRIIIVSPDGELGFWENWHDGSRHYRDWVVDDLMPYITERYNTLPCPQGCYLSGISMGAHGAMRFAYYEKGQFNSVAALSGPIISKQYQSEPSLGMMIMRWFLPIERIWGDIDGDNSDMPKDIDPYKSWVKREDLLQLPLLLAWGTEEGDAIREGNEHFHQHLSRHNKPHEHLVFDGGHKWVHWRGIMDEVIMFHTRNHESKK